MIRRWTAWNVAIAVVAVIATTPPVLARGDDIYDSREDVRRAQDQPFIRGGVTYKAYCANCHGETGNGATPLRSVFGRERLRLHKVPKAKIRRAIVSGVIRNDGEVGMPGFGDRLSDRQIDELVAYTSILKVPEARGEVVFLTNCVLCHGVFGNGKGRAGRLFNPPPADLTRSDKNDMYKRMIITLGGEAMGRSKVMPKWGQQLSEQEISDVVVYINQLLRTEQRTARR